MGAAQGGGGNEGGLKGRKSTGRGTRRMGGDGGRHGTTRRSEKGEGGHRKGRDGGQMEEAGSQPLLKISQRLRTVLYVFQCRPSTRQRAEAERASDIT